MPDPICGARHPDYSAHCARPAHGASEHAANCPCGCLLLWPATSPGQERAQQERAQQERAQLAAAGMIADTGYTNGEAKALLAGLVGWPAEDIRGYVVVVIDDDNKAGLGSNLAAADVSPVLRATAKIQDLVMDQGPGVPRLNPGPPRTRKDTPPC